MNDSDTYLVNQNQQKLETLRAAIGKVVIGQQQVINQLLITLLAGGHVLLEGVPGLGKTLLVQTLAKLFHVQYKRIQFTPDLMPADITGHTLYDSAQGNFKIRRGPVFTNFLLADEINRAPAKTQAALLEVMQEQQVTIEGESLAVQPPFMVLATQNPLEQEGTYPLPEAELDRFLMKIQMDYPSELDEVVLTQNVLRGTIEQFFKSPNEHMLNAEFIKELQQLCASLTVDDSIVHYAAQLVRHTRSQAALTQGAGPRATIGLVQCARAEAILNNRTFVLPDDIQAVFHPVLRHRVALSAEAEIDGLKIDDILTQVLKSVAAPR